MIGKQMLLLLLLLAAPGSSWDSYANARFGYSVEYPADLMKAQPEATNGDGREFYARKSTARFMAYGNFVTEPGDFASDVHYPEQECVGGKATYKLMRPTVWVLSCPTKKGAILYSKAFYAKGAESHFEARYPASEKAIWDPVVSRMAGSLSPPVPFE